MTGKPTVTANQVTLLRLLLMPLPGWLLYHGPRGQYAALLVGTLLGCTDFIDGYLARQHGPTVLGSLMDPIADKVFIVVCFIPAVDLHWVPAWLVSALFAREFLVTAARTCYERRGQSLKSTYLARYKTWVQMCGMGMLILLYNAPSRVMSALLAVATFLPAIFFALYYLLTRKRWRGAVFFSASFGSLLILHALLGSRPTALVLTYFIVGMTWASGLGYLVSIGRLRGRGAVTAGEAVRLITAVLLPVLALMAQARSAPPWAIVGLLSVELAHGGLDNLLAHHQAEAGWREWGMRLGLECVLLAYAWLTGSHTAVVWSCALACVLGTVALVYAFWQKRQYYLGVPGPSPALSAPRLVV